jgi:hypothetical protein
MGDLVRGYSFTDGVVDDCSSAHLHALVESAQIQTSFHTDKTSAGASPAAATHEVMLYRNSDATWRKATLAAAIFDSGEMLASRTAKTAPVAADLLLLGDSAAANALKKITLSNLLFAAAVWPSETLDGAADRFVAWNASTGAVHRFPMSYLITQATPTAGVAGTELLVNSTALGVMNSVSIVGLVTQATALANPASADIIGLYDQSAGAWRRTTLVELITGLTTTVTSPAGTERMAISDSGTLKQMALSALSSFVQLPYAVAAQVQTANTQGGAGTTGAWLARTFNTSVYDPSGLLSQINGYIVLQAGTYRFRARAPGYGCGIHRLRLFNATDAAVLVVPGPAVRATANTQVEAQLTGRFTIASGKHITLDHWIEANNSGSDFGLAVDFNSEAEYYCVIEFWKEP